eukprot:6150400-Prymnesium_polylepis.1
MAPACTSVDGAASLGAEPNAAGSSLDESPAPAALAGGGSGVAIVSKYSARRASIRIGRWACQAPTWRVRRRERGASHGRELAWWRVAVRGGAAWRVRSGSW